MGEGLSEGHAAHHALQAVPAARPAEPLGDRPSGGLAEGVDDAEDLEATVVVVADQVGGPVVDAAEAVLVGGQRLLGGELTGLLQRVEVGGERVALGAGVHADRRADAGKQVVAGEQDAGGGVVQAEVAGGVPGVHTARTSCRARGSRSPSSTARSGSAISSRPRIRSGFTGTVLSVLTFLVGFILWTAVLSDSRPAVARLRRAAVYTASIPGGLIGLALLISSQPLVAGHAHAGTLLGPIADQRAGGLVMMVVEAIFLIPVLLHSARSR
ncbi:cytochrome c oxidase assembly protein [Paractinoplanes lichenicola]|uniref:Cytochrome c oxidase assembly protein n=1 Tax=Paractinoplanes lichenicola TaxID=2802976 RepID=A0ABS1VMT0_9ACTN|nr:cytochrome c oxidase assembly protein [Actinoplanes lichenicola]MBL7255964.1 cytochrome c oxidase assembly protein [Actinoplanes lichenicola]